MAHQTRVLNGSLDMHNGNIILRGVIDPKYLTNIQVAPYQRERRSVSKLKDMIAAVKTGTQLPDIEIGVRGANYREREGVFYLDDDCFIIDGLQRLTACERAIAENAEIDVRLGCMFHFNTSEKWERDRFKAVNGGDGGRVAVSPNVLLRNSAEDSISVDALLIMTSNDREFVLRNKISWGQNKGRGELLTALMVLKIIGVLHSHFGPGRSNRYHELYRAMDKTMGIVGNNIWRANVRHFFGVVDQAFGITSIKFVDLSVHMKGGFLKALAEMFSEHSTFWDGTRLKVERLDVDKLGIRYIFSVCF
jgi:hypothetical protein